MTLHSRQLDLAHSLTLSDPRGKKVLAGIILAKVAFWLCAFVLLSVDTR